MDFPITLITTLGSSPAILTETIWGIHKRTSWGKVSNIEIITTNHGKEKLEEELQKESPNKFEELFDILDIDLTTQDLLDSIHVPKYRGGPLDDIKTPEHDKATGEKIKQIVQEHANNKDAIIVASLAGGRKTMGSRLSSAMELFGRAEDKLVHVLVNEPFERRDINFWFPEQEQQKLTDPRDDKKFVFATDARIELIELSYLRLGQLVKLGVNTNNDLDSLIDKLRDRAIILAGKEIKTLLINVGERKIVINKEPHSFYLQSRRFQIFIFFVLLNRASNKPVAISFKTMIHKYHEVLKKIYELIGGDQGDFEDGISKYLQNTNDERKYEFIFSTFATYRSNIRGKIETALTNSDLSKELIFTIQETGPYGKTLLPVQPHSIIIEDEEKTEEAQQMLVELIKK